jgi:hypothetical protein
MVMVGVFEGDVIDVDGYGGGVLLEEVLMMMVMGVCY